MSVSVEESLKDLRGLIARLKSEPLYNKAAVAEKSLDAILRVLENQQLQINQLKKEKK